MKKIKLIALFGPAGAGKDFILDALESHLQYTNIDCHKVMRCTTRPERTYTKQDQDEDNKNIEYYHLTDEDFKNKEKNNFFVTTTFFVVNNETTLWWYGTPWEELKEDTLNIGIFNIGEIRDMLCIPEIEVYPIYIQANDKVRIMRQLTREEYPNIHEICRRFLSDEKDYKNIDFNFLRLDNSSDLRYYPQLINIINVCQNSSIIQ